MADEMLLQDVDDLAHDSVFEGFDNSTVLITGATGLIGSLFVKGLVRWNELNDGHISVIALARDYDKVKKVFGASASNGDIEVAISDVEHRSIMPGSIDWICHGASITSSWMFAHKPVEVILTEVEGARAMLDVALTKQVKGFVYLSSLEAYGDIPEDHGYVYEEDAGLLDWRVPRNSYPESKRLCEALCLGYEREHDVPVRIARLAQTFGPGVSKNDNRVFAQFARAAMQGQPIVMHTPGEGRRCYCSTVDAVRALAYILLHGSSGEAYNVANENTYCSVKEMAEMLVARYSETGTSLVFDFPDDVASFGYAAPSYVKLNSGKLQALGWKPIYDLPEMYDRLIGSLSS